MFQDKSIILNKMENEIELKLTKKPLEQKEIIDDIDDIIYLSLVGRTVVC